MAASCAPAADYELIGHIQPEQPVRVYLQGATTPFKATTEADLNGRFHFRKRPGGTYVLAVGGLQRTVEVGPSLADSKGRVNATVVLQDIDAGPGLEHRASVSRPALSGDPAIVQLLLSKGADVKATKDVAIANAVDVGCSKCLRLTTAHPIDRDAASLALADIAQIGDLEAVRLMLDLGADVKFYDPLGRTALMNAAASDLLPLDEVKLLVEHGADVNAIDRHNKGGDSGLSPFSISQELHGETPIVDFLVKSGAKSTTQVAANFKPRRGTLGKRHSDQPADNPEGRRQFHAQGRLRFLPSQQLRRHGGRPCAERGVPG